jgi:chromosome segregation ATPase
LIRQLADRYRQASDRLEKTLAVYAGTLQSTGRLTENCTTEDQAGAIERLHASLKGMEKEIQNDQQDLERLTTEIVDQQAAAMERARAAAETALAEAPGVKIAYEAFKPAYESCLPPPPRPRRPLRDIGS